MTIVKNETVELSENEKKAFELVDRILENIIKTSNSPVLFSDAFHLDNKLVEFYQNHCEEGKNE